MFVISPGKQSATGTFYDVVRAGDTQVVATLVIRRDRPQVLELCHPSPINRVDGAAGPFEIELLAWLTDRRAVAAALASIHAGPVGSVAWKEWVRHTIARP